MEKGILYRKIKQADNEQLAAMIKNVFIEHDAPKQGTVYSDPTTNDLYSLFKDTNSVLWVAEVNGMPMGCCGIYPTTNLPIGYAELVKFYIAKSIRNKGIGLQLFKQCLQTAKEIGYTHLYIESLPHYNKAVQLYTSFGFKLLQQPLGNSGHTSCNIWMLKEL